MVVGGCCTALFLETADVDGRLVFRVDIVWVVLGSSGGVAAAMRRLGFWGAFVEARFWFPVGSVVVEGRNMFGVCG
ncbi:hypothetical protein OIU74_021227 [Salix koriyanagi]|uniref:Uncharacterized protein n=2 Tax=Salix TaxID=40685 RepID=A0A9Q0P7M8_9ROSI|nr:hypothetical protein OIU74_021227 [Salix koriyanagi]